MLLGLVEESGYQCTHPHHLNLFPVNRLCTQLAKQQTLQIHLSNLTCSFCFQCKSLHVVFAILLKSKQSLTKCNVLHYHVLL